MHDVVLVKTGCCSLFLAYIDLAVQQMDYRHRLMAMGVGGVASLFALFFSPPKTNREAMIRFAAGCTVAFTCVGHTLSWLRMDVNPDSVMMLALIWGSVSWSILGGLVRWGESGGAFSTLSRIVQGALAKQTEQGPSVPSKVEQVRSIEESKGE